MSDQTIPVFDLQTHHHRVEVPTSFDIRDLARKHVVFPIRVIEHNGTKRLLLAMKNPYHSEAITEAQFRSGMYVIPVLATEKEIRWLIQVHYYGMKLSPDPSSDDQPQTFEAWFEEVTAQKTADSPKSKS